jgi:predicted TIM-barrel fold metal-dependent hydrolase
MMTTRREFVAASALAVATRGRAADRKSPIVDTHIHCFAGKADKRFPYHPRGPYQPDDPATPQDLLKAMDAAGVDFAVIVHPEPYQDDHRYQEYCLKVDPKRLKGSCLFFADQPKSLAAMKDLVGKGGIVTARVHAYNPDRLPPFGKPELKAFWKQAGELGLALQLHFEPRYAAGFEPLIREFKEFRVIIDHLGRPFQGTPKEYDAVVAWAKYPNTIMKLSSIPQQRMYPHRPIAPIVKRLIEAWGAERLIYGGGWQGDAAGKGYRAERDRLQTFLTALSAADQAKVLGGNAARLFRLGSQE